MTSLLRFFIATLSISTLAASAALVTRYEYPQQAGYENLAKTDPEHRILTDGRVGADGPSAVWSQWDQRHIIIDWSFAQTAHLQSIEFDIVHPNENKDTSHPHRLSFYPVLAKNAPFPAAPLFSVDIPFEPGRLQTVKIDLSGRKLVANKLRTLFESDGHQVVLSEVQFEGRIATSAETESARQAAIEAVSASEARPHYDYPQQSGYEHITKTDPGRILLTDGKIGTAGNQAVWGKWGSKEMVIDWTFAQATRVKAIKFTIVHPKAQSEDSHASAIQVFASATKNIPFLAEPDFSRSIPFEEGSLQTVRFVFPQGGVIGRHFRTLFAAGRHQVVLSEVSFENEPVTEKENMEAQQNRKKAQPEQFAPVTWLPQPLAPDARVNGDSIFGVCGHFLHTNLFFAGDPVRFNKHWRPSYTLPWLINGNFNWIRETLYLSKFRITGNQASSGITNRKRIEDYLQRYQDHGMKVLLCPMFGGVATTGVTEEFAEEAAWVGSLAQRFPAVRAIELHNEPNLKGFWKGTAKEFVDSARAFTAEVKKIAPNVPIVAGSFSGWGGAWDHQELKALLQGEREIATKYAEELFRLGLLEFADAVSAHPYRGRSAPEGGDVLEARDDPEGFEKEIRSWLDLAAKYTPNNKRLPLYLTEIGYSVSNQGYTNVPTEARQADYITRLMLISFAVKLQGIPLKAVFWYDLKQDEIEGNDYEKNFGIVAPNASRPRPAWNAVRRINEFFAQNADFIQMDIATQPIFSNGQDLIKCYAWRRMSDGALIIPFWRMNQLMRKDADFDSELRFRLPEGFTMKEIRLYDLHEDRPRSIGFQSTQEEITVPLHVTARAAWLEILKQAD